MTRNISEIKLDLNLRKNYKVQKIDTQLVVKKEWKRAFLMFRIY